MSGKPANRKAYWVRTAKASETTYSCKLAFRNGKPLSLNEKKETDTEVEVSIPVSFTTGGGAEIYVDKVTRKDTGEKVSIADLPVKDLEKLSWQAAAANK